MHKPAHTLCRHQNHGNYRYRGACEILNVEWQGKSQNPDFTLFEQATSPDVEYTYNTNTPDTIPMGGHALLTVAARPVANAPLLLDYVHLRIDGTNPARANVLSFIDRVLAGRNANILHMVRAIFAHESGYTQFLPDPQRSTRMTFRQRHHGNDVTQPDCQVRFNWPDDPTNFPLATFDFGIGISQYTKTVGRTLGPGVVWDWRENIKIAINLFLGHLRGQFEAGLSWRQWARPAWRRYNGSGAQAVQYAATLLASAEGQLVSADAVPTDINVDGETARLDLAASLPAAPSWPGI